MNLDKIIENTRVSYDKAGQKYFDFFHDELDNHEFDQKLLKFFAGSLSSDPIICDFGCGPAAQYANFLVPFAKKVYALDISPKNITIAKEHNSNLYFKCENMLDTSFKDSSLDGIISFYSIFHIPKEFDYKFFEEVSRVLKPGGKILIMTHKGDLVQTFNELWDHDDLTLFVNFHTEEELIASTKKSGLIVESCYSKESYYPFPEERIILTLRNP
jgi:SAM-dependent methyltransferase